MRNKNSRFVLCLLVIGVKSVGAYAQNAITPEMDRLRTSYEAARERATRPVDEKYLSELSKLQDTYTRGAKLEQAVAVANEIKRMRERLGMPEAPAAPALMPSTPAAANPTSGGLETTIIIPANDPNGYRLGGVKRGDTITLQYVEGVWKSQGGIATESPDRLAATYGDNDRLVIARGIDAKGQPGDVIKIVPPETAAKPFTFVFPTSRDEVVLRINSNSGRKENPGKVTYKMKLVR